MNPVTMLQDPRPLEDPAYWDRCPTFREFCDIVSQELDEYYDRQIDVEFIMESYYVRREYEMGVDYKEAARCYYDYEIEWD